MTLSINFLRDKTSGGQDSKNVWRRGNSDAARKLHIGDASIGLQLIQNVPINRIEADFHTGLLRKSLAQTGGAPSAHQARRMHHAAAFRIRAGGAREPRLLS